MYKEIKEKLNTLAIESSTLRKEVNKIEESMISLQKERAEAMEELISIAKEVRPLERELRKLDKIELRKLNGKTGFENDFIRASVFASRDNERAILQMVNIEGSRLMAMCAEKAIVIENNEIPEELQFTYIPYYIREDFSASSRLIDGEYVGLEKLMNDVMKTAKYVIKNIPAKYFKETFKTETPESGIIKLTHPVHEDFIIYFNKSILGDALWALKNTVFDVYFSTPTSPLVLKSSKRTIMICPMKVAEDKNHE